MSLKFCHWSPCGPAAILALTCGLPTYQCSFCAWMPTHDLAIGLYRGSPPANLWRIDSCIRLVVSIIACAAYGFAERTTMTHSPLVVLGGGPGGYAAAFFAADEGLE